MGFRLPRELAPGGGGHGLLPPGRQRVPGAAVLVVVGGGAVLPGVAGAAVGGVGSRSPDGPGVLAPGKGPAAGTRGGVGRHHCGEFRLGRAANRRAAHRGVLLHLHPGLGTRPRRPPRRRRPVAGPAARTLPRTAGLCRARRDRPWGFPDHRRVGVPGAVGGHARAGGRAGDRRRYRRHPAVAAGAAQRGGPVPGADLVLVVPVALPGDRLPLPGAEARAVRLSAGTGHHPGTVGGVVPLDRRPHPALGLAVRWPQCHGRSRDCDRPVCVQGGVTVGTTVVVVLPILAAAFAQSGHGRRPRGSTGGHRAAQHRPAPRRRRRGCGTRVGLQCHPRRACGRGWRPGRIRGRLPRRPGHPDGPPAGRDRRDHLAGADHAGEVGRLVAAGECRLVLQRVGRVPVLHLRNTRGDQDRRALRRLPHRRLVPGAAPRT